MKGKWSQQELAKLEQLVGDYPRFMVAKEYNDWASRNRYPRRTSQAISTMAYRERMSFRPDGSYVNVAYISQVLNVPYATVRAWVKRGCLPAATACAWMYVKRADFVKMAKEKPHFLAGLDVDRLNVLLEDLELAKTVSKSAPGRGTLRRPVRAVETNKVFPGIRAAAAFVYVNHTSLRNSILRNGTCAGYHWEYV